MSIQRLNKFLAQRGICSRREADRWIEAGRLVVDGETATLGISVGPDSKIALDGKDLILSQEKPKRIIIAYHKPVGVESTQDPDNPRSIDKALNWNGPRVFMIGRLDIASEGLLLMTNDGDLVNPILRSSENHEKEYVVVFDKVISDQQIKTMRSGVDIGDGDRGLTKPCTVERLGGNRIKICLTEGRNRQIRRMAEAFELRVVRLKRVRVMNILLENIPKGEWRYLTKKEELTLLELLGL